MIWVGKEIIMPTSDPIEILLAHNQWATRQILEACAKLTPEQFHKRFEMGPGSLHDTITHILAATRGWGDLLAGRELRPPQQEPQRSVPELSTMLDELSADMSASSRKGPLDELLTRTRGGKTYTFTRGAALTHIMTHNMHHRAQCLNMLRHVGVSPLPPSSVMEWTWMGDGKA
jgi:uncharacterized damage-inducible protein DinB